MMHGSGTIWIEPNPVIHGILKTLLAAQIPFCSFDGNMSQEKLNLLKFTSCLMAESRACPAPMPNSEICRIFSPSLAAMRILRLIDSA